MKNKTSRRDFVRLALTSTAAAGLAPAIFTGKAAAEPARRFSPADNIRIGLIGMGIIGNYDIETALRIPGTEIVAMADLYDSRREHAKELFGQNLFTTRDYREVLARPDVDAVIIAVPDHWHARIATDALEAGKHVYCEKPMVQKVEDGIPVIEAWRKSGKVMQIGSQYASSPTYRKAKELYESGIIGKLNTIEAVNSRNNNIGAWQYSIPPSASPQNIDWDRFLGNTPKREFDPVRFFRWRNYWDYGTGIAGDLFVHQFTGAHTVTSAIGPTEVMATGGLRYWKDGREVPDMLQAVFNYPETQQHPAFTLALRVNLADASVGDKPDMRFIGSDGTIDVYGERLVVTHKPIDYTTDERSLVYGYNSLRSMSKATQEEFVQWLRKQPKPQAPAGNFPPSQEWRAPQGSSANIEHFATFFNAIRNNAKVLEDPIFGFRAAAPSVLANASFKEKRVIQWNPEKMQVIS